MGKGAIHYTGTNFRRLPRLDIVHRMRALTSQGLVDRPSWLRAAERSPPLELYNLKLLDRRVQNKYLSLTRDVLRKYPNMRFQDCYVDGNDWSKGNDVYRSDHPVMQFVSLQLRLMNMGIDRKTAFKRAELAFYERRMQLEKQQKLHMAAAVMTAAALDPSVSNSLYFQEEEEQRHEGKEEEDPQSNRRRGRTKPSQTPRPCMPTSSYARLTAAGLGAVEPLFTTGHAYWQFEIAKSQASHLLRIRHVLRRMRLQAEAKASSSFSSEEGRSKKEAGAPLSTPPSKEEEGISHNDLSSSSSSPPLRKSNGSLSLLRSRHRSHLTVRDRAFSPAERLRRSRKIEEEEEKERREQLRSLSPSSFSSSRDQESNFSSSLDADTERRRGERNERGVGGREREEEKWREDELKEKKEGERRRENLENEEKKKVLESWRKEDQRKRSSMMYPNDMWNEEDLGHLTREDLWENDGDWLLNHLDDAEERTPSSFSSFSSFSR